jgi:hypothetical protein
MQFDIDKLDGKERYKVLGATVTPRPIVGCRPSEPTES